MKWFIRKEERYQWENEQWEGIDKRTLELREKEWDGIIISVAIQLHKSLVSHKKGSLLPKCYLILRRKWEGFISMSKSKRISREGVDLGGLVTSCGFFGPDVANQDIDCG